MTVGSKTLGTSIAVATNSGPGFIKIGAGTRTWSGADYPKTKPTYTIINTSHWAERMRVKKGKIYVTQVYKPRFVRIRNRPPKRARIEEHAYTMSHTSQDDFVFNYRSSPSWAWRTGTGSNTGMFTPTFTNGWTSNHDIALLGKLREAVAGSDFNAGVFLGEGREALSMITNAATRIAKALRAAKKGNFPQAAEFLTKGTTRHRGSRKVIASNWLELQYGWLPLLKDAEGGAQFLAHQMSVPLQHVVKVSVLAGGRVSNNWSQATISKSYVYQRKRIKCILKEKDVIALSGLTDPLSVAWELVPYSFVVDWFIPIGNYLAARGLSQSLSGTFVTSTKFYRKAEGFTITPDAAKRWEVDGSQKSQKFEAVSFSRSISTTLAVPRPSVKPLSQVFSWKRAANAVALLSQLKH